LDVIDGVTYHRLDPDFDRWRGPDETIARTAHEADRLVRRLHPAVLHAASNFQNAQAAFALRDRHGLPVVYEVRGFLEDSWASRQDDSDESPHDADWYLRAKAAETIAITAADVVVTLSETMRADIVARGADPGRIHVIPNAVDISQFRPVDRDAELAARIGLPADATTLGYVSTFAKYEGIEYLIEAAAILRDRGRATPVLLVGDGPHRDALQRHAADLDLDDGTVIFAGRVPHSDVRRWYSLIDVFVVPRTADRVSQLVTPLKPYEAMALERATVVSGVDALREMIIDGETGLVFKPENPTSLADTVEPLLDDAGARLALGRAARTWVAANRSWAQNGALYLGLYRQLGAA
jgi:glycosyltransferase involved in cell wall biosynthesis